MSAEYVEDLERRLEANRARRRARATTARAAIAPPMPAAPPTKPPPVGEPTSTAPPHGSEQRPIARSTPVELAARVAQRALSTAELEDLARRGDVTAKHPDLKYTPSVRHDQARAVMLALPDVRYVEALELVGAAREGEDVEELARRVDLARRGDPVARRPDARWAESPVHEKARKLMLADPKLRYVEALRLVWAGDSKS